jgi:cbb3-type cytochrome oxidase subunit 3
MNEQPRRSLRERYRMLVSLLIIPLGMIITVRALMAGVQAWTLILLGLAFIGLGVVRLWAYRQSTRSSTMHRGR